MVKLASMVSVNPEILVWARETAGLSPEEAADKLQISDARGVPAVVRLRQLEEGQEQPSRPLLLKMAKQYRRPLLTFYMARPPLKGDRGQDFRTLPDRESPATDALVDALIRDVRSRQALVRAVMEDEDEAAPLPFVGAREMSDGVPALVKSIRDTIGISLQDFRSRATTEKAFALLRDGAEAAGVFVLLIGNLGSHHSALSVKAFRGFALADPVAPFVVINDQDAKAAWSFTLLHELAHIWLGATGVSGAFSENKVERFCNDVASEFLLPETDLGKFALEDTADLDEMSRKVGLFAQERNVSRSLVAYRLFRQGRIAQPTWEGLTKLFDEERRALEAQKRSEDRGEGGPSYYVVRRHKLGGALLNFVRRTVAAGALTPTKAGRVLGVKARSIQNLLNAS